MAEHLDITGWLGYWWPEGRLAAPVKVRLHTGPPPAAPAADGYRAGQRFTATWATATDWPRRPGDHAFPPSGGPCPDCRVAHFLDATGPCTYGMEPSRPGRESGWAVWDGAAPGLARDRHRHAQGGDDSFREHDHPGGWTPHDHPPRACPDQGRCHHECPPGACFRVHCCGPLSGTYPGDTWPAEVRAAYEPGGWL